MREVNVQLHFGETPVDVGTLVERERQIHWSWDAAFLAGPHTISPYALPKQPGLHTHRSKSGVPIPGVFSDSRPDGWGLKLLHTAFAASGGQVRATRRRHRVRPT